MLDSSVARPDPTTGWLAPYVCIALRLIEARPAPLLQMTAAHGGSESRASDCLRRSAPEGRVVVQSVCRGSTRARPPFVVQSACDPGPLHPASIVDPTELCGPATVAVVKVPECQLC